MNREPVVVLPDGRRVRCAFCRADLRAVWGTPGRQNEGHIGVRFGDADYVGGWRIKLDGEDVTNRCVEALAGPEDWAILWVENDQGERMLCQVGKNHGLAELVYGDVRIERRASA